MRRARSSDAAAIRALVLRAYAHYPDRVGMRPAPMDAAYDQEIALKEIWVAPAEGAPTGVIVLRGEVDHLFVDNIAVAPEAQGTGLGRAMLAHAERRAAELKLGELRLLTHALMTENRAFYTALGWTHLEAPVDERLPRVYFRKTVG